MDDLSHLSVMLIEPSTNVRTSLHNLFTQCGITHITHMMRASTAIPVLQRQTFDIILCEYDLSEGQNGQHLLEDLRQHRILPQTTLFIIITAERAQSKVISTVELAPTEYLLKPFTADSLLTRISQALNKRHAFLPVYRAIENGDLEEAIAQCELGISTAPRYVIDFLFMRAELHLQLGQADQAEAIYRKLTETKANERARLGLGKVLTVQGRYDEAQQMLTELLEQNRKLWEAYDTLARVHEACGRLSEAKKVLQDAVALSPHATERLRRLGRLAMELGDTDTALNAFQEVVGKIRHSNFRNPEDYVHLVQVLLSRGKVQQAANVVKDLGKSLSDFKKTEACGAISNALLHEYKKETEQAMKQLAAAVVASGNNAGLSNEMKMLLAKSCLNNGMEDYAADVMLDVMNNAADDITRRKAIALLEQAGRTELGESLLEESRQQVAALLAACEEKIAQADFKGAAELMLQGAEKMPNNPDVALSTAATVLNCINQTGWSDELGSHAHWYIDNARRIAPTHPRLAGVTSEYRATLKKFSIPLSRMSTKSRLR